MSSSSRRRSRQQHGRGFRFVIGTITALLAIMALGTAVASALVGNWIKDVPDYTDIDIYSESQITRIYASDGTTLLAELYLEDREPVDSASISDYVKSATVAVEDERFYEHDGVDVTGVIRAMLVNLASGGTEEGASTITMQLVRNTLLIDQMNDITLERKVKEAYLALEVEQIYSKDEILTMYLNTVNYGDGAYGIEAAANHYFNKSASDLTLAEAALLAGIPQSPTYNNPKNYPDTALARRNVVLDRMLSNGMITQEEYDEAASSPLGLDPEPENSSDGIYLYPYFTSWVRQLPLEDYSSEVVYSGGLTVYTTLDVDKQEAAEAACNDKLATMEDDVEASLTSIDPDNGYVVALVGGRDYYADQFNLATQAERQAGSCFKVFTLVAAIEEGISPQTRISCSSPVTIDGWEVENYGGASYSARTIQQATQISSNTAFARLISEIGADKVVDVAERMGITSSLEAVPSITLGTQGVNTLQMASAFATLASGGVYHEPKFITQIISREGDVVYDASEDLEGEQVLTPEVAHATTEVLESVVTSGTATSAQLSNQVSAGKTGTSQNYRDSMYCGYTPQLSTSVWIGSREERAISDNMGGSNCCPVWKQYMTAALAGVEEEDFPDADDPPYTDDTFDDLLSSSDSNSSSSEGSGTYGTDTGTGTTDTDDVSTDEGVVEDGSDATSSEDTSGSDSSASGDSGSESGELGTLSASPPDT